MKTTGVRLLILGLALTAVAFTATACKRNKVIEVIGGYAWKANFIDQKGYVITNGFHDKRNQGIDTQYNFANPEINLDAGWAPFESDNADRKPFTCGVCHTTGYTAEGDAPAEGYAGSDSCKNCHNTTHSAIISAFNESGHQHAMTDVADGPPELPFTEIPEPPETFTFGTTGSYDFSKLPGIQGQWEEPNIGCEACHGPSKAHAIAKDDLAKRPDLAIARQSCAQCHVSGDLQDGQIVADGQIETDGNLVLLGQEWEEWQASPHSMPDNATDNVTYPSCITCHNPHASTLFDNETAGQGRLVYTNEQCKTCHADTTIDIPEMAAAGVMCIDCHMPYAGIAAFGYPFIGADGNYAYVGDVRSHQFKIRPGVKKNSYINVSTRRVNLDEDGKTLGLPLDIVCQPCHSANGFRPHGLPAATPYKFVDVNAEAANVHLK